jgi:hypothetical protein
MHLTASITCVGKTCWNCTKPREGEALAALDACRVGRSAIDSELECATALAYISLRLNPSYRPFVLADVQSVASIMVNGHADRHAGDRRDDGGHHVR